MSTTQVKLEINQNNFPSLLDYFMNTSEVIGYRCPLSQVISSKLKRAEDSSPLYTVYVYNNSVTITDHTPREQLPGEKWNETCARINNAQNSIRTISINHDLQDWIAKFDRKIHEVKNGITSDSNASIMSESLFNMIGDLDSFIELPSEIVAPISSN